MLWKTEDVNELQPHIKKNDQTEPTIQRNLMQGYTVTVEKYMKDVKVSSNLLYSGLAEH